MTTTIDKATDSAFGIALLALFLVSIAILLVKGVFAPAEVDILSKGINSSIGCGGCTGSAVLYMKWRVNREANLKKVDPNLAAKLSTKKDKNEQ